MRKRIKTISRVLSIILLTTLVFPQSVCATEELNTDNEIVSIIENEDDLGKLDEKDNLNNDENGEVSQKEEKESLSDFENEVEPLDSEKIEESGDTEELSDNEIEVLSNFGYSITVTLNNPQAELRLAPDSFELCPDSKNIDDTKLNSEKLQNVIDLVADAGGGTVIIPRGTYYFYPIKKNFNTKDSILTSEDVNYLNYYIIKCRDNVTVSGTLEENGTIGTRLCPIAFLPYPIDMFYFADIIDCVEDKYDTTQAKWLTNADFRDFIIDYSDTINYGYYNAKGKGFYIVLLKDCDWNNVTVKYTNGTGFGVDCPINCTMANCTAIACGKQATSQSVGGSGFGIGFGYSNDESMLIENCLSIGNRKFGYFFENQARFENYYKAETSKGFIVKNCTARGNLYNFGGEMCSNTYYIDCISEAIKDTDPNPLNVTNKCAYYFGTNSKDYHIIQNGKEINKYLANKQYYTDVHGWFVDEGWFDKILESEIMYGYSDINGELTYVFGQEDPVTRGQVAVMLYRYCYPDRRQSSYVESTIPFDDNQSYVFYTEAMNWAYKQGFFTGYKNSDGSTSKYIRPENNITREELATVLCRFAGKEGADTVNFDKTAYLNAADANKVSVWAKDSIAWCYSNRIMTGGAIDRRLNPSDAATRSQAAKMILQMLATIR